MTRSLERSGARKVRVDLPQRMPLWDALPFVAPLVTTSLQLPTTRGGSPCELVVSTADLWREDRWLTLSGTAGHAYVFANRAHVGTIPPSFGTKSVNLPARSGQLAVISHLAGNAAQPPVTDLVDGLDAPFEDLVGGALTSIREVAGWEVRTLDLNAIDGLRERLARRFSTLRRHAGPVFCRGSVRGEHGGEADAVLEAGDWGRGLVWVGGTLVGCYAADEPVRIPAELLVGDTDLVLLELERPGRSAVTLLPAR